MSAPIAARLDRWQRVGDLPGCAAALSVLDASDLLGAVLVGTPTGVLSCADGTGWSPMGQELSLVTALAVSTVEDGPGPAVWAGGADGLHRWDRSGGGWRRVLDAAHVTAVCVLGVQDAPGSRDAIVLVGTAEDGVFRSEDGGTSWNSASSGLFDLRITALVAARPGLVVLGTETGPYASRNSGCSWRPPDGDSPAPAVHALAVSTDRVYAGTSAGLWVSADGGRWQPVGDRPGPEVNGVCTFGDGRVVVQTGSEQTGSELAVAEQSGATWQPLPAPASTCFALAPATDGRGLLAATHLDGLQRLDGSGPWRRVGGRLPNTAVGRLYAPTDGGPILWAGADGLARTADGGRSWEPAELPAHAVLDVAADGEHALVATVAGLFLAGPGGWRELLAGPVAAVARTHGGVAAARAGGGQILFRQDEPAVGATAPAAGAALAAWSVPSELPAPVEQLHAWPVGQPEHPRHDLLAVTVSAADGVPRRTLWRSPGPAGPWSRVLSAVDRGPMVVLTRGGQADVCVRGVLFRIGATGRPVEVGPVVSAGSAGAAGSDHEATVAVMDLCVLPDGTLVAATSCGLLASADGGGSWDRHPDTRPDRSVTACVSVAHDGLVAVAVDRQARVWSNPLHSIWSA